MRSMVDGAGIKRGGWHPPPPPPSAVPLPRDAGEERRAACAVEWPFPAYASIV